MARRPPRVGSRRGAGQRHTIDALDVHDGFALCKGRRGGVVPACSPQEGLAATRSG